MMNKVLAIGFLLFCVAFGTRSCSTPNVAPGALPDDAAGWPVEGDVDEDLGLLSFWSNELIQECFLNAGESSLIISNLETSSANVVVDRRRYTTSYRLRTAHGRWANELYVVGADVHQHDIVERWTITPPTGAYVVDRPTYQTAIGVPIPSNEEPTISVEGGNYIQPSQREAPSVKRRVILDTTALAPIRDITVDLNGRFILVLASNGSIYQVQCPPPESAIVSGGPGFHQVPLHEPVLLVGPADYPELANTDSLRNAYHSVRGRIYAAAGMNLEMSPLPFLEMVDADNDGLMDELNMTDYVTWITAWNADPNGVNGFEY